MKKDIFKLGLSLALFAAGACVALALVYSVTKPTIDGLERKQIEASLRDLFPEADSFTSIEPALETAVPGITVSGAWKASKGDATLGMAAKTLGKSYGGDAVLLVGVTTDRRIAGVRVLSLNDTAGLGANAASPSYFVDKSTKMTFPGQFSGKPVLDAFEVKKDVIAISASTITSKALTAMVKAIGASGAAWLEAQASGGAQ